MFVGVNHMSGCILGKNKGFHCGVSEHQFVNTEMKGDILS